MITEADNVDDLALLTNALSHAESLLHSLEQAAGGIHLYMIVVLNKTKPSQH